VDGHGGSGCVVDEKRWCYLEWDGKKM